MITSAPAELTISAISRNSSFPIGAIFAGMTSTATGGERSASSQDPTGQKRTFVWEAGKQLASNGPEAVPDFADKDRRLFQRAEVATSLRLVPIDQVREYPLRPDLR